MNLQLAIDTGPIEGALFGDSQEVAAFKGIPFAAPPVGILRWQPPQPVRPWSELRPCKNYGPACTQPRSVAFDTPMRMSEDCLYLNVWSSAKSDSIQRPVMVWIHGGGHVTGSGSSLAYDGQHFARRGIVLVTINYRLGPLGYFAHPELSNESPNNVSGNYGELDILAALQWVQRNISEFGGDPNCVTLFGESAGAVSIAKLMTSPFAVGLFHRAICQSGSPFGKRRLRNDPALTGSPESTEVQGVRIAAELGIGPNDFAALRDIPAEVLVKATNPAQGLYGQGEPFGPVIDGWLYPEDAFTVFAERRQMPIPLLLGSNANEGSIFLKQQPVKTLADYRAFLTKRFGNLDRALEYFPCDTESEVLAAMERVITVSNFVAPARFMAEAVAAASQPAYLYHFTRRPNTERVKRDGVFHALEIMYVFETNARLRGMDDTDRALAAQMNAYWSNFARAGNPNATDLPTWSPYSAAAQAYLELNETPAVYGELYKDACDFLETAARLP